ncbi:UNVERIFIED_ORG: LacI family transcriptional regulator [Paenarthrobacter nicotinovorans]
MSESARQRKRHTPKSGATIRMVAKEAGVSTATVSRVLTQSGTVKPELEERVRRAIEALGYEPNAAARGLSNGSLRNIGIIMPDMTNPYFFHVVDQVTRGASEDGYRVLMASSYGNPDQELATALELRPQVDGLILLSSRIGASGLRELARAKTPTVLVNRVEQGVDLPVAAVDHMAATMQLCGHLFSLGHRKVVYLSGSTLSWQDQERWKGMLMARHMGLETVRVESEGTIESAYEAMDQALGFKPTAIVAFNDLAAVGALSRLQDLGISVPDQMSLTGFDDIPLSRHIQPHLTTVHSPTRELGDLAWNLMSQSLAGEANLEVRYALAELILRDSTGPAARSVASIQ